MKAFLSSTYTDLIEHRKFAAEALERLGQQVGRMEVFGARPAEATQACLAEIEACGIFVGIYAHRYGYIPSGSQISITEAEYDHAVKHQKPIFCFMVDEEHPWPPKMIEEPSGRTKLQNFKQHISKSYVRDTFTTPEDLAFKLAASIGRYLTQDNGLPQQDLLHKYWDVLEPELQDALALAYNQSRRYGSKTIKTRYLFAAMRKLRPEPLNDLFNLLPVEALPEPVEENNTTKEYVLNEKPNFSACVLDSIEHIGQHATSKRKISVEDVFVDIAKNGAGSSVSRLRAHGVNARKINQAVDQLGWRIIER